MKKGQLLFATILLITLMLAGCDRPFWSTNINEGNHLPSKNTEQIAILYATTLTPEMPQPTTTGFLEYTTPLQPIPSATFDSGQLSRQIDSATNDLDKFLNDLNTTDTLKDLK